MSGYYSYYIAKNSINIFNPPIWEDRPISYGLIHHFKLGQPPTYSIDQCSASVHDKILVHLVSCSVAREKLKLLQRNLNLMRNNNIELKALHQRELERNIALSRCLFDISPAFREDYWRSWRNQEEPTPGDV
ncbi:9675_t:CDS:2 [Gigaspora rosea]|nr:9675_t:CDS:2 [Gigaspora rosea]